MRSVGAGAAAVLILFAGGCRNLASRRKAQAPTGVAIEFRDSAPVLTGDEVARLRTVGVHSLFLAAGEVAPSGGGVEWTEVAPPKAPSVFPVTLVVTAREPFGAAIASDPDSFARSVSIHLRKALEAAERYGKIDGVHLEIPVEPTDDHAYAEAVRKLRALLPPGLRISVALYRTAGPEERKAERELVGAADLVVVYAFGRIPQADSPGIPAHADAHTVDSYGVPMLIGFVPGGSATVADAGGDTRGVLGDSILNALSEDSRFDFSFGSVLSGEPENVYIFTAERDCRLESLSLRPGDTVTFRLRSAADLLNAVGESLTGRRNALGSLFVLSGVGGGQSLLGFDVLEDVLLGRPVQPQFALTLADQAEHRGEMRFAVSLTNQKAEFSALSRLNNWIDVEIQGGTLVDARNGGFDRFELLDARGGSASPRNARHVRFFENFIAPGEHIVSGPILVRGNPKGFRVTARGQVSLPDSTTLQIPETVLR
jgi:hypothetical protein